MDKKKVEEKEIQRRDAGKQGGSRWLVMAACFCMIFVCLGFCSSNKGIYLSAITEALDIPRSLFSINDTVRFLVTALLNLYFGALVIRWGAKKMVAAGFLSLIGSVLLYAYATHVYVFYIGGCLLGIGIAWTGTTMVSYLVNRWVPEHRGTVMGVVLCANGLGGALAAQVMTPIIYQEETMFGYRTAYKLVALLLLVTGILAVILVKEPTTGMAAGDIPKKKARGKQWIGMEYAEAKRKPYFYATAICVFITGMGLSGIGGIAPAHMKDVGLSTEYVALILSVHSLVLMGAKFLTGFSYDKLGFRFTLTICEVFSVVAYVSLALAASGGLEHVLSMVYGVTSSLALPLETVMVPLIAAEFFGEKDYAKILGIFVSVNVAGYAAGTPLANVCYDVFCSYVPVLYLFAAAMLVVILIFHFIMRQVKAERERLGCL